MALEENSRNALCSEEPVLFQRTVAFTALNGTATFSQPTGVTLNVKARLFLGPVLPFPTLPPSLRVLRVLLDSSRLLVFFLTP